MPNKKYLKNSSFTAIIDSIVMNSLPATWALKIVIRSKEPKTNNNTDILTCDS